MTGHFRSIVGVAVVSAWVAAGCNKTNDRDRQNTQPTTGANGTSGVTNPNAADAGVTATEGAPAPANTGEKSGPMSDLDKDMKRVIDQLGALGAKPIDGLSPAAARKEPTPADAVKAILQRDGKPITPEAVGKTEDKSIKTPQGTLMARIYTPVEGKAPRPVVLYFHGGGFVIGSLDAYDATPRSLANGTGAVVVSADYRQAPEHKFPAAHEDAYAAYGWVLKNAASFGGDPRNVAVAGESAGGNLAANVAIMARAKSEAVPTHLLLVYPIASANLDSDSYKEDADVKPLSKSAMTWFMDKYLRSPADWHDPRIDLVNAKLNGLPPTTIITAQIDPLRSDGEALEKKLKEANVDVDSKNYKGVTHEFFGMGAVVDDAKNAMKYACSELKDAFDKHANSSSGL
ncbi:MAG TPA: alpha/beta hydrolase [Polyangiaceae bacterium]|nr:alpha/beta hydrolase [Polyangiaceae bacterium]